MEYTQTYLDSSKNITFNDVQSYGSFTGSIPVGIKNNYLFSDEDEEHISNIVNQKIINAIDIHWNGAQVGNTTINTTGDLLNYIKGAYSSSSGNSDFTPLEISALRALIDENTGIASQLSSLEERVRTIETMLGINSGSTSDPSSNTLVDRIETIENNLGAIDLSEVKTNADKVASTNITAEKLENLINHSAFVSLVKNGKGEYNRILVTKASNPANSIVGNGFTVNTVADTYFVSGIKLNGGDTASGIVNIDYSGKLNKTAIDYDEDNKLITINKNG